MTVSRHSWISAIITAVFWATVIVVICNIKVPERKAESKSTIKITLQDFEPVTAEKTLYESASQDQEQQSDGQSDLQQSESPSVPEPVNEMQKETSARHAESVLKPEPAPVSRKQPGDIEPVAKSETEPIPGKPTFVPPAIKKSVEERMAEQNAKQSSQARTFDASDYGGWEESKSASSSAAGKTPAVSGSSISGSSGTSSKTDTSSVTATSEKNTGDGSTAGLSEKLGKIKKTSGKYSSSLDNFFSRVEASMGASNGGNYMEMKDGKYRQLLQPKSPSINIWSDTSLISETRSVTVSFRVLSDGSVPLTSVSITPSSQLPQEIRTEIQNQVARWRFEPGSAESEASFKYTLEIR